eukprot:CAMPEP_0118826520 /NCGR_PEP_ID=MMETSP1162-20130426/12019_1 /TAXON_ID=33656 /ORGANISM="Phaeocystis Sp, Strain CCMP2710" /LENGTH=288 /DNA_ID=CAMNT_0006757261 /DNA_START=249 /DNA_END=1111 /DNA_ORIENTATION=+
MAAHPRADGAPRAAAAQGELLSAAAAVAGKNDRLVALVLVYERRVLKVRDERDLALDARVRDLAHLVRVEAVPLLVVELLVEGEDVAGRDEVDEGVAHVAPVLEVNGQVEQVELALVPVLDGGEQHLLVVLVGDVAHHQRGALVVAHAHARQVERVVHAVLLAVVRPPPSTEGAAAGLVVGLVAARARAAAAARMHPPPPRHLLRRRSARAAAGVALAPRRALAHRTHAARARRQRAASKVGHAAGAEVGHAPWRGLVRQLGTVRVRRVRARLAARERARVVPRVHSG